MLFYFIEKMALELGSVSSHFGPRHAFKISIWDLANHLMLQQRRDKTEQLKKDECFHLVA